MSTQTRLDDSLVAASSEANKAHASSWPSSVVASVRREMSGFSMKLM
jgi:hypothetical protein